MKDSHEHNQRLIRVFWKVDTFCDIIFNIGSPLLYLLWESDNENHHVLVLNSDNYMQMTRSKALLRKPKSAFQYSQKSQWLPPEGRQRTAQWRCTGTDGPSLCRSSGWRLDAHQTPSAAELLGLQSWSTLGESSSLQLDGCQTDP